MVRFSDYTILQPYDTPYNDERDIAKKVELLEEYAIYARLTTHYTKRLLAIILGVLMMKYPII
mgnify:CR=1 FL=1